jgi:hypothetical protein
VGLTAADRLFGPDPCAGGHHVTSWAIRWHGAANRHVLRGECASCRTYFDEPVPADHPHRQTDCHVCHHETLRARPGGGC